MQRSPWSVFRKPQFFHTFSVILILSNYRKCMGKSRFSKNWSRTSLHSRFSILFLWTCKLFFLKRKHQTYEFRKIYRALNSNTNLLISRHFALITHGRTISVNFSILQLEILVYHLTNCGFTVNGTALITNPLSWISILRISNPKNSFSKRIHKIKCPDLDLPKGTRSPF